MLVNPNYIRSDRREMLPFILNRPRTSLEIGCREGLFSLLLKQNLQVTETWGVEIDATPAAEARENLDHFFHGAFPLDDGSLPSEYFDLIVFNDVLEHMYDPWEALIRGRDLLAPGGQILASIPNVKHKLVLRNLILHDNFEYTQGGNLDSTHIRFFTKSGMIKLFEDTGYAVIRILPSVPIKNLLWRFLAWISPNHLESFYVHQYVLVATIRKPESV
jgi:SAM-dependent methyltransferase